MIILDLSYKTAEVNHAFPPVVPFCGDGHALTAFSYSCFAATVMIPLISRLHRRKHETQEDIDFLAMCGAGSTEGLGFPPRAHMQGDASNSSFLPCIALKGVASLTF